MADRLEHGVSLWVRVLDALAVALILLGVSMMLTGGFRERTPLGLISVTSWSRPLVMALVLLLLRHAFQRQPSLASRITWSVKRQRGSPDARVIWPVFLTTRAGVLIVGFLGIALLGYAPNTPPYRIYDNDFLNMPARWDTGWYLGIAQKGYRWEPAQPGEMQNIAFFPLYPLLIRYGSLLLARQHLWTGVLISLVCFFFALRYLFRLARESIGDDAAAAAVSFLAAYPFALFYNAAYTEGLFLLTMTAACYHFGRAESWKAALWGLAAGLSRPNGCLLSVVLALMAMRDRWWVPSDGTASPPARRALVPQLAAAAAPGIGMLIFSTYIFFLTGNPLQWVEAHAPFGRVYRNLDPIVERIEYIQVNGLYNYASALTLDMLNAVPTLFALGSVWPVYRRFGAPYAAMILVNVLPAVMMGGVLSIGRITSTIFPIFLWLGAAIPQHQRSHWLMIFAMLQALCAITFFTWRPLV